MSLQDHIAALRVRHADLETAIQQEIARPLPDEQRLSELKRQKLRLKDMIVALSRHAGEESEIETGAFSPLSARRTAAPARPQV